MPSLVFAFNPNPDNSNQSPQISASKSSQPRTASASTAPLQRISFPPAGTPRQIPIENQSYTTTSNASSTTASATSIAPVSSVPAAIPPTAAPQYPPVDDSTAKLAAATQTTATSLPPATIDNAAMTRSYVAPAPLAATQQSGTPNAMPEPTGADPAIASLPKISFQPLGAPTAPATLTTSSQEPESTPLSDKSKKILSQIPSKLDKTQKPKGGKLNMSRMSPEMQSLVDSSQKVESFDSVGMSIKVRRPGLDTNYELNQAYTSLMGGDTTTAISIYKNILSADAENQDALFGLAATYHRVGELDKARPYYGRLLKLNPQHREGLNNFLSLIGDEAPQEALAELERLEQRNPEFSPIPAQQGILLDKMGFYEQARDKMLRAIDLAPDNITYKYNLAVMLDRQGLYADAGAIYRQLIDAGLKGQKIPATLESLQKRLNFISTAAAPARAVGG